MKTTSHDCADPRSSTTGEGVTFTDLQPLESSPAERAISKRLEASIAQIAGVRVRLRRSYGPGVTVLDLSWGGEAEWKLNLDGFAGLTTIKYAPPSTLMRNIPQLKNGVEKVTAFQREVDLHTELDSFPVLVILPSGNSTYTFLSRKGTGDQRVDLPLSPEEHKSFQEYIQALHRKLAME